MTKEKSFLGLVRGQVSRAEEEETSYAIQSELLLLKRSHLETSHQLEVSNEEIRALSLRLQENVSIYVKYYRNLLCVGGWSKILTLVFT